MCTSFHASEDSSVMSVKIGLHMDMVTHTCAHTRHTQPKMAHSSITLRCHQCQMVPVSLTAVCAAAEEDFIPITLPALIFMPLSGKQDWGELQLKINPELK